MEQFLGERLTRAIAVLLAPLNRFTLRRWLDLIGLTLVSCAIVLLLLVPVLRAAAAAAGNGAEFTVKVLHRPDLRGSGYCYAVFVSLVGIVLVVLSTLLIHLRALGLGQLRALILYPPAWLAAVMASVACCGMEVVPSGQSAYRDGALVACAATVAALGIDYLRTKRRKAQRPPNRASDAAATAKNADDVLAAFASDPKGRLIPWLMLEEPVSSPEEDLFGSCRYAQHIAELLTERRKASIGLIGPFGAGKTTVLNLTQYLLHKSKTFHREYLDRWQAQSCFAFSSFARWRPPLVMTCRVRAWGFASEPAVAVVLRALVAELSRRVDCLALRALPEQYVGAMKGLAPSWMVAPLTLAAAEGPSQQLKRLDPVLKAIGARLVVFIEDVDRNVPLPDVSLQQSIHNQGENIRSDFHNNVSARPDGRVLSEMQALLDRMREIESVSFVVAMAGSDT